MNTRGGDADLNPAAKEEVSNFMQQVLERTFVLEADRVRFEADDQEILLRFYAKRDLLRSSHMRSGAFEVVWKWLMHEAFSAFKSGGRDPSTFKASLPFNDGRVFFLVQRSKTLRQKTSMLLCDFKIYAAGEKCPDTEESIRPEQIYNSTELQQLRKIAELDSQALPRPRYVKSDQSLRPEKERETSILIVEDHDDQRLLMRKALERAKYRVQEARDGEEAMRILKTALPDLVITDLMMPKVDGAELLQRMKADPRLKSIPVMVFTAISDPAVEFDILDMGADDYCEKTASPKIFLKRLEHLVSKGVPLED